MSQESPQIVVDLVARFERNLASYRSQGYNETQLRREFLDPLFEALGWDVANKEGAAEAYKDVIHEDAIKVGGVTKAPDYCFRIGRERKFFLEAKKPSVNIKDDLSPAYQLRRYAWSAKLPLSILTDFEEFAVYDCRTSPAPTDKPSTGRILYLTYKEYSASWGEIASTFSKEAVRKGSFDKYAAADRKRGTDTVDEKFLAEIEHWREQLAKHLAIRYPKLSEDDLTFAVQRTIDRIIFLRICEDRGIEPPAQLQGLLNGEHTYDRLKQLYDQADDRYNSGLFHFRSEKDRAEAPDELTLKLKIDDKVLKDIIGRLYPPKSPYEFSVFPAEILGQVYEQFLGKVIRLTTGHHAKVEEKPEVKKAGGVYYTPAYIVDYIVKQTVGKLCEGKTPKQLEKLRILDPACGSGSFLIGAYDSLMAYHHDWYVDNGPDKHKRELYRAASGEWRLTTKEKRRILLNNIYGVDIDSQAVEVTKMSLLLKVLEGESDETLRRQLSFVHERALPDLGNNIKCGNSLIGPDYFEAQLLPDDQERKQINPFDWKAGFQEIMKAGGFDVVIGNPPWGADFSMDAKEYLMSKFERVHMRTPDSFNYFLCQAYDLVRENGLISMIVPNNFLFQHEYARSREYFCKKAWLHQVVNLGDGVFEVTAPSCIIVIKRMIVNPSKAITSVIDLRQPDRKLLPQYLKDISFHSIGVNDILSSPDCIIPMDRNATQLIARILKRSPILLGDLCEEVAAGIGTGGDKAFRLEDKKANSLRIEKDILHPVLIGREMNSYYTPNRTGFSIIYSTKSISSKTHPRTLKYLKPFQPELSQKRETKKGLIPWWSLHWPRYPDLFSEPKVILRQTANSLYSSLDTRGYYCLNSIIIVRPKDYRMCKYLVGLFNSRLLRWLYKNFTQEQNRTFAEVKPINLRKLPIYPINYSKQTDKAKHDKIVMFVERMLDLHKRLAAANNPNDKTRLQHQVDATDREIDRLVYDLYDLTEKEIAIVEGKPEAAS